MLAIRTQRQAAWLILFCPLLAGCNPGGEAANQQAQANAPVANAAPAVPRPQPPMDRAALLQAVAEARSAVAAGTDDVAAQRALGGKAFEFRIRFGCSGPSTGAKGPSLSWSFDSKTGVLRVRADPDLSSADPAVAGTEGIEAVEGFWLARPWLLNAACPVKSVAATDGADEASEDEAPATAVVGPKVGIAQFFTATDPRTSRRDHRAYEAVEKLTPGASVGQQGFDLALSGRLRAFPDGRVIRCTAAGDDQAPTCIISAQFDHVWIDEVATGRRIADWSPS
jgi:hypothetical protein